ncbi:hypothetical protein J2Y48_002141 [Mycoplana sp. BE70]|nr:hypothetical protein [Mycoplana sp. BE70]
MMVAAAGMSRYEWTPHDEAEADGPEPRDTGKGVP